MATGLFAVFLIMLFGFLVFLSLGLIVKECTERFLGPEIIKKSGVVINTVAHSVFLVVVIVCLSFFTPLWTEADMLTGMSICLLLSLFSMGSAVLFKLSPKRRTWNKVLFIISVFLGTVLITPPLFIILGFH